MKYESKNIYRFATTQTTIRDALNSAMSEEIQRDEKVFLMGKKIDIYNIQDLIKIILNYS